MSKLLDLLEEPEKGTLVYIPTDRIDPHPDNPRKDLGDLTELSDSIKHNGILQNLTVVPWFSSITRQPADDDSMDGYYRALIGHRRLAAAKLAGLEEVPCVIVEMDYRDQLQTMLQENMQRSDLTVYEQAQGFQMMLDLGETVETLAEKSGFSQSTIRRRVKLLDLDEKAFKASVERGATLADYAELDKIEDAGAKNRVLAAIGTPNFHSLLKQEVEKERQKKNTAAWREALSAFATEVENQYEYQTVKCWYNNAPIKEFVAPEDADTVQYYFYLSSWGSVYLLKDRVAVKQDSKTTEQAKREEQERKRKNELKDAGNRAFELRATFAADVSVSVVKKHLPEIAAYWVYLATITGEMIDTDELLEEFMIPTEENEDGEEQVRYEDCLEKVQRTPEWALWRMIWLYLADGEWETYADWTGDHEENRKLDGIYQLLCALGYQMSDEEKQLQDGTHPLFRKEA